MNPPQTLQDLLKSKTISQKTYECTIIAKSYIEQKYKIKKTEDEIKLKDWENFNSKLNSLNISLETKEKVVQAIQHKEAQINRKLRQKVTVNDFIPLTVIGRGAFGEVRVCRHIQTNTIVAIKKMRKEEMQTKNQILHILTEKEVMSKSNNPWIVNLRYSFQDDKYLYLVMDYLPGGDLMNLLMKEEILSESKAKFYTAELVLAVESVHNLGCIHRDLKPDNVWINKFGHLQLSDFGLSKLSDNALYPMSSQNNKVNDKKQQSSWSSFRKRNRRLEAFSTVGTPDYIAPEVFGKSGYSEDVDWWSIGVILFEMWIGYPPFYSNTPNETCQKIINWKRHFIIPQQPKISDEAKDWIKRLLSGIEERITVDQIKKHPFFKGINWNNIMNTRAPFIPDIKNEADTKYFDSYDEEEPFYPEENNKQKKYKLKKKQDIYYAGYNYNQDIELAKEERVNYTTDIIDDLNKNFHENSMNQNNIKTKESSNSFGDDVTEEDYTETDYAGDYCISPTKINKITVTAVKSNNEVIDYQKHMQVNTESSVIPNKLICLLGSNYVRTSPNISKINTIPKGNKMQTKQWWSRNVEEHQKVTLSKDNEISNHQNNSITNLSSGRAYSAKSRAKNDDSRLVYTRVGIGIKSNLSKNKILNQKLSKEKTKIKNENISFNKNKNNQNTSYRSNIKEIPKYPNMNHMKLKESSGISTLSKPNAQCGGFVTKK